MPSNSTSAAASPAPVPSMRFIDWASLHYHLLWAYEGPVPRIALEGDYTDSATSCWLIRRGSVVLRIGRQVVTARPGDWAFVASPTRHQTFTADAEILSLHFDLTWPGGESVINRTKNLIVLGSHVPQMEKAAMQVVRVMRRHFPHAGAFLATERCDRALYLKIQSLLPGLLNAYLDTQETLDNPPTLRGGQDERVLRGVAELDRVPLDRRIGQPEIATRLGLSRSHMDALFTAHLGVTPRRYLELRRLETARRMLSRTGKSVKAIALELGFKHESHFCLWFKRQHGTRPSALREG
ncbi:MAG: helix-turn-helix transcriptional regulator [Opitutaceae bacterium]